MSYQAATTYRKSLNSMPQTQHHQNPHIAAPIKLENDSDEDDVVFLKSVPKVEHTPEEYDPECKCSTCQVVRKLQAECTCEDCTGTGQADHSAENVVICTEMAPQNSQPSESSIEINDASTSEHISENDQNGRSRSSTMDDDSIVEEDGKELGQEIESEDDDFPRPSTSESLKRAKRSMRSTKHPLPESSLRSARLKDGQMVCPKCQRKMPTEPHLKIHLRSHKKPGFRCAWSGCGFFYSRLQCAKKHVCTDHLQVETASTQQTNQHLVRVNPMTGETGSVRNNQRTNVNANGNSRLSTSGSRLASATNHQTTGDEFNSNEIESDDNDHDKDDSIDDSAYARSRPSTSKSLKSATTKRSKQSSFKSVGLKKHQKACPKCQRVLPTEGHLRIHLLSHKKSGFRCTWSGCGFFYTRIRCANKHVLADHLQVETASAQQINQHLVRVDPKSGETGSVGITNNTRRNLKASDHSQPSTSSRLSSVTNLHASEEEDNSSEFESDDKDKDNLDCGKSSCSPTNQANPLNCPKCEVSFATRNNLLRHYRCVHLQLKPYYCKWPKCSYTAAIRDNVVTHANSKHFNSDNRKQAKNYVAIRQLASPNDPMLESLLKSGHVTKSIGQTIRPSSNCRQHLVKANPIVGKKLKKGQRACPQCKRILDKNHLKNHLRTHKTSGFRCNWSGCGFFYSTLPAAKKHVCDDHLQVEAVSTQQINRHLVKVNPKTGKTESVKHSVRKSQQTFNKNCPKCGRNIRIAAQFRNHIRTHLNSGYRCTWGQCGFFYSQLEIAKQHILKDHLQGKLVNTTQIQNHLVRVDHRTGRTNRVKFQSKKK